jgi:hypothetical protein
MVKKNILFTLIILNALLCTGCSANNKTHATQPSSVGNGSITITPTMNDNDLNLQEKESEMLIQRNSDCFRFQCNDLKHQGLIEDINNLLWIVPRGGAGITDVATENDSSELPIVALSNSILDKELTSYTAEDNYTWIRLVYDTYIPPAGVNAVGHKDIVIYIQPDNPDDAIFAIQDPVENSKWNITSMPGYGCWLSTEIDMLLRMMTGF